MREPLLTRPFLLASAGHFLHGLSYYFLLALPGFLEKGGATEVQIGVTFGVAGAAAIVARPPLGRFMDTRGRRGVMLGGGATAVAASLAYLLVSGFGPLVVAVRIVHGLAEAMLFASLFAFASDIVPASRRIEGIALFGVSGLVPMAVGSVLSDVILRHGSYDHLFVSAAAAAFAALLLTVPLRESHARLEGGEAPRGVLVSAAERELVPLWIIGLAFATALSGPFVFMKTFVVAKGDGNVAPFFAAYGLTATLVRLVAGGAPERLGPKRVLVPSVVAFLVGLVALMLGPSHLVLAIAGIACGLGHGFVFPILLGLVVERARPSERGAALSVFTALFDAGALVGGPLLGATVRGLGYGPMFGLAAVITTVGTTAFFLLDRRAAPRPVPVPDSHTPTPLP